MNIFTIVASVVKRTSDKTARSGRLERIDRCRLGQEEKEEEEKKKSDTEKKTMPLFAPKLFTSQ